MTALVMLYDPFKSISQANNTIQQALAGAERVFEILDSEELRQETGGDHVYAPPFTSLSFRDITFCYPGVSEPALKNITLDIRAGERVALVGQSGSGKTTLAHLIPRFHDSGQGEIFLNDRPLREYALPSLRANIGIVSQEPFLFNLTVRENIAYGHPEVDAEKIKDAARAAYAHDFIMELPKDTRPLSGKKASNSPEGRNSA